MSGTRTAGGSLEWIWRRDELTSPSHLFFPFRHAVQARAPLLGMFIAGGRPAGALWFDISTGTGFKFVEIVFCLLNCGSP